MRHWPGCPNTDCGGTVPQSIHAEVRRAAAETGVGLHMFLRTGEYVWVQVDEISERFVILLQQFAMNGVAVEASQTDRPWHKPS